MRDFLIWLFAMAWISLFFVSIAYPPLIVVPLGMFAALLFVNWVIHG